MDPITTIILGAVGNGLYALGKKEGTENLSTHRKLYERLTEAQWNRLKAGLEAPVAYYQSDGSQDSLAAIGEVFRQIIADEGEAFANGIRQLMAETDELKGMLGSGFDELKQGQREIQRLITATGGREIKIEIYQDVTPLVIDPGTLLTLIDREPLLQLATHALSTALTPIYQALDTGAADVLIADASGRYAAEYEKRHGHLKILQMREPIALEDVYVAVQFLKESHPYRSINDLRDAYGKGDNRSFQFGEGRTSGIVVANDQQYLMVLGGPGVGKSTFLRKVGLEALKGSDGFYTHDCIPVFLELKRFREPEVDIPAAIANEFDICGFPDAAALTEAALESGRLLVLLDGLDEVPEANLDTVIERIEDFVDRHSTNRFIASCRIAAYNSRRTRFGHFTDVEIADFDDHQIRAYLFNWFEANHDPEKVTHDEQMKTARYCWETLNDASHKATKELAQTPLLLTLLCMVYDESQTLPWHRAQLYGEAFDVLLKKWAAEKRVHRAPIYKELPFRLETVMLSEIAYDGLSTGTLFFDVDDLRDRIREFLAGTLNVAKILDSERVLDAIAIQQGIVVERVPSVYSFSHLTLQEYLTARRIAGSQERIQDAVTRHLLDDRWREVFLLTAGLMDEADALLLVIEAAGRKFIAPHLKRGMFRRPSKLETVLQWANEITAGLVGKDNPSAKRAYAIRQFFGLALARALVHDHDHARDLALAFDLAHALDNDRALDRALNFDFDFAFDLAHARALAFDFPFHQVSPFQRTLAG